MAATALSVRILGGGAKGRAIKVPDSARPSTARLRKSLFDLLFSRCPQGSFIDLHGGSGAIGLEAASRGYAVTLIERDTRAVKQLEHSARDLGLSVKVRRGDTQALLSQLSPHDVIFSDPPYSQDIPKLTHQILQSAVMGPRSLLIVQHPTQVSAPAVSGFEVERRTYGSNVLSLYTRQADEEAAAQHEARFS